MAAKMNKAARPLIFGEVLFDLFPDGSTVLGGAPFNVAWHLQAFGGSPLFISRVGNDSLGRRIRNAMEAWGLSTAGLQQDSEHPTGTVEVRIEGGQPAYDIVTNRAYDHIRADNVPPATPALIYHGMLALRNPVSAGTLSTLKKEYKAPVFLDVNLRPPWWNPQQVREALHDARWVKLNEDELDVLVEGASTPANKIKTLLDSRSVELVILTCGSNGAAAFTRAGKAAEVEPGADIPVVDTVGAGDAFTSVTILGLMLEWPLQQTVERAQEFASAIVGVRGATIQDKSFYQPFIQSWELPVP
jgi:fructokinase